MPYLDVERGRIWYELHGEEGQPFATILPAASVAGWMYDRLRDDLARDFRLLTFEYRGIGRSLNEVWSPTPGLLAQDVLQLLDHVRAERTHVVGLSLGTFVMAEVLHRAFDRLDRCAVGCMPVARDIFNPPVEDSDGLLPEDWPEAMTWAQVAKAIVPVFFSKWYREAFPEDYARAEARIARQSASQMLAGIQQLYSVLAYDYNRLRVYERLPPGRRLFLAGEKDMMTLPENLRAHPLTSRGPTVVFQRSGHMFFYEQADAVAEVVRHFWRTGAPPSALTGEPRPVPLEALA